MQEPEVSNSGYMYSIRDALVRIEAMIGANLDEYANPPNSQLADLDEAAWNYHDMLEEHTAND